MVFFVSKHTCIFVFFFNNRSRAISTTTETKCWKVWAKWSTIRALLRTPPCCRSDPEPASSCMLFVNPFCNYIFRHHLQNHSKIIDLFSIMIYSVSLSFLLVGFLRSFFPNRSLEGSINATETQLAGFLFSAKSTTESTWFPSRERSKITKAVYIHQTKYK